MNTLLRLPSAVVVWLANAWLRDADANAIARSCTAMMQAMQRYRWKERISLQHAVGMQSTPSASSAATVVVGAQHRFGLIQRVHVPEERELSLAALPDALRRLPSTVVGVTFADNWNAPVESLQLPASVRSIHLGWRFDKPIRAWRLPSALTELTLSNNFNQPIDGVQLPSTLRRLIFGAGVFGLFKHSLAALSLPRGLEELRLSSSWNCPLSDLPALPPSLLVLDLGDRFNHPLETLQQPWPPQLRTLTLGSSFNRPLGAQLPETITELRLGYDWNHSLVGVRFPSTLTSLTIGTSFSRSLNGVTWPAGLRSLTLPANWNQLVAGLRLPPSLTQFNPGSSFCQSLREWDPPASLTDFTLSHAWKGFGAEDLRLPERLTRFRLPAEWKIELADLTLPASLRSLTLGRETRVADPARVRFPAALTELDLGECALSSLAGFAWPPGLTHLCTGSFRGPLLDWAPPVSLTRLDLWAWDGCNQPISELHLPPHLVELSFGPTFNRSLTGLQCPPSLASLSLHINSDFNHPLTAGTLPQSLRHLCLPNAWKQPLHQLCLPSQLQSLSMCCRVDSALEDLQLPESLRELELRWRIARSLNSLRLPSSLRVLTVACSGTPRAPPDFPASVPPQLHRVELQFERIDRVSRSIASVWRDWIAGCSQANQRGCVVLEMKTS